MSGDIDPYSEKEHLESSVIHARQAVRNIKTEEKLYGQSADTKKRMIRAVQYLEDAEEEKRKKTDPYYDRDDY